MPSLKEIKTRIASVNSTRKITSAMKMVASSKLHHAQVAIQNMLPYGNMLEHILKSFLVSTPNVDHPLQLEHKETKRVALVVYSSNMAKISILLHIHKFFAKKSSRKVQRECIFQ